jgi:hypothetical protein
MRYILVGRSVEDNSTYKILAIQTEQFSVPEGGRHTVRFREVINQYSEGGAYSQSKSGFKVIGYVLHAERAKDQREVYSFASITQLEDALNLILALKEGDLTDDTFVKKTALRIGEERRDEGPIIIR